MFQLADALGIVLRFLFATTIGPSRRILRCITAIEAAPSLIVHGLTAPVEGTHLEAAVIVDPHIAIGCITIRTNTDTGPGLS